MTDPDQAPLAERFSTHPEWADPQVRLAAYLLEGNGLAVWAEGPLLVTVLLAEEVELLIQLYGFPDWTPPESFCVRVPLRQLVKALIEHHGRTWMNRATMDRDLIKLLMAGFEVTFLERRGGDHNDRARAT